jgi:hypothetical protein
MKTLKVQKWSGEALMTRDEFVAVWSEQLMDVWAITNSEADRELAKTLKDGLKELAGRHFDQHAEEN